MSTSEFGGFVPDLDTDMRGAYVPAVQFVPCDPRRPLGRQKLVRYAEGETGHGSQIIEPGSVSPGIRAFKVWGTTAPGADTPPSLEAAQRCSRFDSQFNRGPLHTFLVSVVKGDLGLVAVTSCIGYSLEAEDVWVPTDGPTHGEPVAQAYMFNDVPYEYGSLRDWVAYHRERASMDNFDPDMAPSDPQASEFLDRSFVTLLRALPDS